MRLIKRMRTQVAVYWEPDTAATSGQVTYLAPVEIKCRWEDRQEEFMSKAGKVEISRAIVYADREIDLLGVLKVGPLSGLPSPSTTDPFSVPEAWEVKARCKIPKLRQKNLTDFNRVLMKVYL